MKSPEISTFLQQRIDAGDFPSAVYLVAEKGETVFHDALGYAVVEPESFEAKLDTIYDLASLTKVLVTALITAKSIEDGAIDLNASIDSYLDEFRAAEYVPLIREVLTHTSKLPAWRPFYLLVDSREQVVAQIAKESVDRESGVVYSDLNFLLLQAIVERKKKSSLDAVTKHELIDSLKLTDTAFDPGKHKCARIAASEFGNEHEKRTCRETGYDAPDDKFRNYQIWGEVHDGNAWFMGGVAGHAGLFSSAEEVFKIALQFLPQYTTLLKPETCDLFRTNLTQGMNEARSFGFELAESPGSTAGSKMSPESFGHLGFTGTSLWIDPVQDRIFVLLTNRTHNHPLPFTNINSVRRHYQNLANELLNRQQ